MIPKTNQELLEKYQWTDDQALLEELYAAVTSKDWCRAVVEAAGENAVVQLQILLSEANEQRGGGRL